MEREGRDVPAECVGLRPDGAGFTHEKGRHDPGLGRLFRRLHRQGGAGTRDGHARSRAAGGLRDEFRRASGLRVGQEVVGHDEAFGFAFLFPQGARGF